MGPRIRRVAWRRGWRGAPTAAQEALFELEVQPQRRYLRQVLDALERSGFGEQVLVDEMLMSRLLGFAWTQGGGSDAEESFGADLVDFARTRYSPTSLALLRALAVLSPIREIRQSALDTAEALADAGLPEPLWQPPLGQVVPGRCWVFEDIYGDSWELLCEFAYGQDLRTAPRHGIAVKVDHVSFGATVDAMLVTDIDATVRQWRVDAATSRALFAFRQVEPAWVRAVLQRAFARTDLVEGVEVEPDLASVRSLVLARLRHLPEDASTLPPDLPPIGDAGIDAVVTRFLASPYAGGLASAEDVARKVARFAATRDPARPERVGPALWDAFVRETAVSLDLPAAAPVLRAWSMWAATSQGLHGQACDNLSAGLDQLLQATPNVATRATAAPSRQGGRSARQPTRPFDG